MLKYKSITSLFSNYVNTSKVWCLNSNVISSRLYCTDTEDEYFHPKTVDLSYASYETAITESKGLPPLIILHGFLGSKSNWTSMSKAIHRTTGRKVIAIDARNHGDSSHTMEHSYRHMADDLVALMKKLNIPKSVLIGHSMGGRTAMAVALMQPDIVSSLIVCDISPIRTSPNIYSMAGLLEVMSLVDIPAGLTLTQARKVADQQLTTIMPDVAIRNFILTNLVQSENKEFKWRVNLPVLKSNFRSNIASFPRSLKNLKYQGPTMFVGGGASDYIGRADLPGIRRIFPAAKLVFIEGAGHWVHSQKPEAFLNITCDFVTKYS